MNGRESAISAPPQAAKFLGLTLDHPCIFRWAYFLLSKFRTISVQSVKRLRHYKFRGPIMCPGCRHHIITVIRNCLWLGLNNLYLHNNQDLVVLSVCRLSILTAGLLGSSWTRVKDSSLHLQQHLIQFCAKGWKLLWNKDVAFNWKEMQTKRLECMSGRNLHYEIKSNKKGEFFGV